MNNTKSNSEHKIKKEKLKHRLKFKYSISDTEYHNEWFKFYPKFTNTDMRYSPYGYFDPRSQLNLTLSFIIGLIIISVFGLSLISFLAIPLMIIGWGEIYISLPFDSGKTDECESPSYGFYLYGNYEKPYMFDEIWLWYGNKSKVIKMAWAFDWYRTSYRLEYGYETKDVIRNNDWYWVHEIKGLGRCSNDDKLPLWNETHDYKYKLANGEIQKVKAKITVKEREWRRYWLPFTSLFNLVNRVIDVEFSKPIGGGVGTWKGGTVGCSYKIKNGEEPIDTLRRMEKERKFSR